MITSKARQQEAMLDELEAKDEDYMRLEEDSAMIRQENEQLIDKIDKYAVNLNHFFS